MGIRSKPAAVLTRHGIDQARRNPRKSWAPGSRGGAANALPSPWWSRRRRWRHDQLHHPHMYQALDGRAHVAALRPAAVQRSSDLRDGPRRLEQLTEVQAIGRLQCQPRSPLGPSIVEGFAARLDPRGDDILAVAVPGV